MTKFFTVIDLTILRSQLTGEFERAVVFFKASPTGENFKTLQTAMLDHQDAQMNAKAEFHKDTTDRTGRFFFIGEPPKAKE